MAASANFSIEGTSVQNGLVTVAASTVVDLAVLNLAGIQSIAWSCVGTHTSGTTPASITALITPAGSPSGATASFTMPAGLGQCYRIRCQVTDTNGRKVTEHGLVGVLNGAGRVPFAAGEELERHRTQGWTDAINAIEDAIISNPTNPGDNGKIVYANAGALAFGTAVTVDIATGATATFFGKESATASAPSFVARSGGHGMFSPASDVTALSANGSEVFRITTVGATQRVAQIGLGGVTTQSCALEIGAGRTGDGSSFIDLVADGITYTDFAMRLVRNAGANGSGALLHRGTGAFNITTVEATTINFATTNINRWTIGSTGSLFPSATDGVLDLGGSANRLAAGYFATAVIVGTTPAQTGSLRLPNAGSLVLRNGTDTGNITAVTSNATNDLVIGDGTNNTTCVVRAATNVQLRTATSTIELQVQAGLVDAQDNEIRTTGFLTVGGAAATIGGVRFNNATAIVWRNAAGSANITGLYVNASNELVIGAATENVRSVIFATTGIDLRIGSTNELVVTAGLVDAQNNEIRTTGFISVGTTPATLGEIRLAHGGGIYSKDSAANQQLLKVNGSDQVEVGDTGRAHAILGATEGSLRDASANQRMRWNATGVAFNGQAPIARPDYTVTNHSDDRALNETADTLAQVANVLGTLINDLISYGILQ